jgi:hypothetical protein
LRPPVPVQEPPVVPQKHVDVWNHKEELASRDPEEPYIIHQTEFKNSETGYTQVTFTYWTVDDVLSDAENKPLHEMDGLVGADNLKWGHGSDDIDVVFVRNDELELEMEICRVYRSFGEEVMGIGVDPEDDSEIEHSSYPRKKTRKRRD